MKKVKKNKAHNEEKNKINGKRYINAMNDRISRQQH